MKMIFRALGALILALVASHSAHAADTLTHNLPAATSPMATGSCLYVDELLGGNHVDRSACGAAGSYWSNLLGLASKPTGSANTPLFNDGSGGFTNGTRAGNTTAVRTSSGSFTAGNAVTTDASGNLVDSGVTPGGGGGGGSPGGSSGSLQYNNAGSFGGATITGLVKGNGGSAPTAAVAGTDYLAPGGALGTPSSGTLTNATGLPISGISGLGTGVAAFMATPPSCSDTGGNHLNYNGTSFSCGTSSSGGGSITPAGVSGDIQTNNGSGDLAALHPATGIATFLATPSSANLRAALTDEVGTGAAYFVGGALGTPASVSLTNATGLPVTGISGLGTGVAAFLVTPPSCSDTGGNHLNYNGTSFSCGTSSSGGGSAPTVADTHSNSVTTPAQISFGAGYVVSGTNGATATVAPTVEVNPQAGASYTLQTTDANYLVHMTNGSATTVTLLAGATAGAGYGVSVKCDAGCTINRSGSDTINGATSLSVAAHQTASLWSNSGSTAWSGAIQPATDPSNATNLISGTVAAARGGAGTVNGVMKANGSGLVSAAVSGTDYAAAPSGGANTPLFNNGSGGFTNGTRVGNTTAVQTSSGSFTAGNAVTTDANGNLVDSGVIPSGGVGSSVSTASIGWQPGSVPTTMTVFTATRTTTVLDITGTVETTFSTGTATVSFYKTASGTACASGTLQHTGSFNAAGTANTNQTLTLSATGSDHVMAAGDRICAVASGTGWTTSHTGAGGITVTMSM